MDNSEQRLEKALNAGFEAFRATFRAIYLQGPAANGNAVSLNSGGLRPGRLQRITERYAAQSWKRHVLEVIHEIIDGDEDKPIRFADFKGYERQFHKLHPDHKSVMSGVAVTLQGLLDDNVLRRAARGVYLLA